VWLSVENKAAIADKNIKMGKKILPNALFMGLEKPIRKATNSAKRLNDECTWQNSGMLYGMDTVSRRNFIYLHI